MDALRRVRLTEIPAAEGRYFVTLRLGYFAVISMRQSALAYPAQ
jgi:hypothetical protein